MQVEKTCGYCYRVFTLTPAIAKRREENSKFGKLFCSPLCSGTFHKERRAREKSKQRSTEAQEYLDGYFDEHDGSHHNIIGGGLATTDNIISGGKLISRMKDEMTKEEMAKLVEANPDMTLSDLINLMDTVPAAATPIAEAPAPVVQAPAPVAGQAPSNAGKFPASRGSVPTSTSQQNEVGITGCDASFWEGDPEFRKCAWSPEHNKFSYWVVDPQEGYVATANDCYRCNAKGVLTASKLQKNFDYDKEHGGTNCKTVEEYILSKKLENPL